MVIFSLFFYLMLLCVNSQSGNKYALVPDKHFIEVLKNEPTGTNITAMEEDVTRPKGTDEQTVNEAKETFHQ